MRSFGDTFLGKCIGVFLMIMVVIYVFGGCHKVDRPKTVLR